MSLGTETGCWEKWIYEKLHDSGKAFILTDKQNFEWIIILFVVNSSHPLGQGLESHIFLNTVLWEIIPTPPF